MMLQGAAGFKVWGGREPRGRGQKESTEEAGTLAAYGFLKIRGTEHFNQNKITCVRCLLRIQKSVSFNSENWLPWQE